MAAPYAIVLPSVPSDPWSFGVWLPSPDMFRSHPDFGFLGNRGPIQGSSSLGLCNDAPGPLRDQRPLADPRDPWPTPSNYLELPGYFVISSAATRNHARGWEAQFT